MRLALVSPLPPAPSGVADFAATLARELGRFAEVDPMPAADPAVLRGYDQRLYQIGNNKLHDAAYDAALAVPGVVELHDAVLHHLLLGRLTTEADYVAEVVYNEGAWAEGLARSLWQRRGGSPADEAFFRYPMLKRIVKPAETVIVHNPAALRRVREADPSAKVVEIPHFIEPMSVPPDAVEEARKTLGADPETLLIGCFGFQRPTKRLRSVLGAVARMDVPWRLVVAGSFVSPDYEGSLGELLRQPGVVRKPHLAPDDLAAAIAAVDVGVNLRWPSAGESSGIAMRLLAAGKPTIVTDSEEWDGFPPGALLRVDPGQVEEEMLTAELDLLAKEHELRETIGEAGRAHVLEKHSLAAVLPQYRHVLRIDPAPVLQ